MTALKTTLFHDEITDNFDVASCTQKIASWDTIRSSSVQRPRDAEKRGPGNEVGCLVSFCTAHVTRQF